MSEGSGLRNALACQTARRLLHCNMPAKVGAHKVLGWLTFASQGTTHHQG
jgi:hypothetical protein